MKKISSIILIMVMIISSCFVFTACNTPEVAPIEIRYKSFIPNGKVGTEYDFTQCFYSEEGVAYSINVVYSKRENGKLVDEKITANGLKFIQNVYADVYVSLVAEKDGIKAVGDEVVVKIKRGGDETEDLIGTGEGFLTVWKPNSDRIDDINVTNDSVNTSTNSYKARTIEYPKTGASVNGEVRIEIRQTLGWYNVDCSVGTFMIDLKPVNRSNKAIIKFESHDNYYGNFVEVELGDKKSGTGWTCNAVKDKEGWFHIEIICNQAGIDKFQKDTQGNCGEVGDDVRIFGIDDIMRIRIEVPFEGEVGTASKLHLDNLKIVGMKSSECFNYTKYTAVYNKLNKGILSNSAVSGGYSGMLSVDETETCNSSDSLKLIQGEEGKTTYPAYWIDLRTLSEDGTKALDLSNATLEFDAKLLFNTVYAFNFDFLDIPNNISLTSSLWLGNGSTPVLDTNAAMNSTGVTFEAVEGKSGWYHIKLDFATSGIDTDDFKKESTAFLRIICSLAATKDTGTVLGYVDNIVFKNF